MKVRTAVTPFELKVLRNMWKRDGSATVAQILDLWEKPPVPGYTTVLKKLQVMEQKGLVGHRREGKAYLYRAVIREADVTRQRIRDLLGSVFGGDRVRFAHAFINDAELTEEELVKLRALISARQKELRHGVR